MIAPVLAFVRVAAAIMAVIVMAVLACSERPAEKTTAPTGDDTTAVTMTSPYAGWQRRSIKALSLEDMERLLAGEGMGYALAAELNRYPGPRHVLDLADSLGLSAAQRESIEAIRVRMSTRAVELGRTTIVAEAALDSLFASGAIDRPTLRARTAQIAQLEGELRATHLEAHLETRAILYDSQVARYDSLRGYVGPRSAPLHDVHDHR